MKKDYFAKLYTLIGLAFLAVVILVMSVFSKDISDTRILGVHTIPTLVPTLIPTIKPTLIPTKIPTLAPTSFPGCASNGMTVSNPALCCTKNAVYIWSSYVCGEVKSTLTAATVTPKKVLTTPTINFNNQNILVPTVGQTSCQAGTLDVECTDASGRKCKWYRDKNCIWTCNQECMTTKSCTPKKLDNLCTSNSGQICYEYQNSDCSIDCSQNCKNKESLGEGQSTRSNVVQNTVSNIFKLVKIGSCSTGYDYNGDGTVNSLDIVFCKNNSSQFSKNVNLFISRVNEGFPKLIDWVVTKMVGN